MQTVVVYQNQRCPYVPKPGGCTAFRSLSSSTVLIHPARWQLRNLLRADRRVILCGQPPADRAGRVVRRRRRGEAEPGGGARTSLSWVVALRSIVIPMAAR